MSSNLNVPLMSGGQANPETTHNDGVGAIDAAITEVLTVDCTLDVTLTSAQYRSAFKFELTPVGSSKTLTLPAVKRMVLVKNAGANSIGIVKGSTTLALGSGASGFFYTDGTANGLEHVGGPFDMSIFVPGLPADNANVLVFVAVRAFSLPVGLAGSQFVSATAATASSTFTLKKNGANIGTIVFTGTSGAATFASAVSFAIGDILSIVSPTPQDATLADVSLNILGSR